MNVERYHARLREVGCVVCKHMGMPPSRTVEIHHVESVRDGSSEWAVVPLCHEHHEGANGVHGLSRGGFERRYKLTQVDSAGAYDKGGDAMRRQLAKPPIIRGHPAHHWAGRRPRDPAKRQWKVASSRRRFNERHAQR